MFEANYWEDLLMEDLFCIWFGGGDAVCSPKICRDTASLYVFTLTVFLWPYVLLVFSRVLRHELVDYHKHEHTFKSHVTVYVLNLF